MKKSLFLYIFLFVFSFSSCAHLNEPSAYFQANSSLGVMNDEISSTETVEETIKQNDIFSDIESPCFESEFPECSQVNSVFNDYLYERLQFLLNDSDTITRYDLDYKVMKNENDIISVVYTGCLYFKEITNPLDFEFTINLTTSGEKIRLRNVKSIDKEFIGVFRNCWFVQCETELKHYLEMYSDDELIALMNTCDDTNSHIFSFFSGNDIIVSFPVSNVTGDFVRIRLPL